MKSQACSVFTDTVQETTLGVTVILKALICVFIRLILLPSVQTGNYLWACLINPVPWVPTIEPGLEKRLFKVCCWNEPQRPSIVADFGTSILYWKSHEVLELGSGGSSANPVCEFWATSVSHCHFLVWQVFWQLASCPYGSLECCCGASRWRQWPFPTLWLPRQAFPFYHQVTHWDIAYSPGKRYPGPEPLPPLSGLVLLVFMFYWVSAMAHSAWGSRDVSCRRSQESIRGICFWPSFLAQLTPLLFRNHPCGSLALTYIYMAPSSRVLDCMLTVCQVRSCPVNTLKVRTLQNSSKSPQYHAQSPLINQSHEKFVE